MSSPVEVVHLGGVQDAATCGISDGSLNLSEEFKTLVGDLSVEFKTLVGDLSEECKTLVGESVTLASPTLSEVFKTHADPALPNLSEEFKALVGESVTLASSKAAS